MIEMCTVLIAFCFASVFDDDDCFHFSWCESALLVLTSLVCCLTAYAVVITVFSIIDLCHYWTVEACQHRDGCLCNGEHGLRNSWYTGQCCSSRCCHRICNC